MLEYLRVATTQQRNLYEHSSAYHLPFHTTLSFQMIATKAVYTDVWELLKECLLLTNIRNRVLEDTVTD